MAGNKTRDGIKMSKILKVAEGIGATIRAGTNHPFILNYAGQRPCPVAPSTDAGRMVAPWIASATDCTNQEAYQALRKGNWN